MSVVALVSFFCLLVGRWQLKSVTLENLSLLWIVQSQSEDSWVKSPKLLDRFFFSFQQPWASSLEKCGSFSWCYFLRPANTTRWGWSLSFSELGTGRKVRKCRILTICADLSISTYLSITWPSCNVSGRIGFIFGLLVGRWHPQSVTLKIWHCCE